MNGVPDRRGNRAAILYPVQSTIFWFAATRLTAVLHAAERQAPSHNPVGRIQTIARIPLAQKNCPMAAVDLEMQISHLAFASALFCARFCEFAAIYNSYLFAK